jgi:hypothetical protein
MVDSRFQGGQQTSSKKLKVCVLGLLFTYWPLGDAVTFRYGQPVFCPMGTFTPLLVRTLRRT